MSEYNIFRPLTHEERADITALGSTTILEMFLKELAVKQSEYQKKSRPYDLYGARMDFDMKVKTSASEYAATVDKTKLPAFEFGDLDKYGDIERFEYTGKNEVQQTRLVAGIKQEVVTGNKYKFKTKGRGNKSSIFIKSEDIAEFDKWLDSAFGEKPKAKSKPAEQKGTEDKTDSKE